MPWRNTDVYWNKRAVTATHVVEQQFLFPMKLGMIIIANNNIRGTES